MPAPESEESTKLNADVVLDKASPADTNRLGLDWANLSAFAAIVALAVSGVWIALDSAITEVDDDVDQLAATVQSLAENVQTLAGDVGYIKGRLESITSPVHTTQSIESPIVVSHIVEDATVVSLTK